MIRVIIFSLLLKSLYGQFLYNENNYEINVRKSLSACTINAIKSNLKLQSVVTFSLTTEELPEKNISLVPLDVTLLSSLFDLNMYTVLIKKANSPKTWFKKEELFIKKSDSYVIHLRSQNEIDKSLNHLKTQLSWNRHAKFMVLLTSWYPNATRTMARIIKKMWSFDVLDGVILIPESINSARIQVFTWFPFADGMCGEDFNKIVKIADCDYGEFLGLKHWFGNKMPKSLNGCPIKVRTYVYPPFVIKPLEGIGLEIKLLNLVAEVANFSIQYLISDKRNDWGYINVPDGIITGVVGALFKGEADVGIGSLSATLERYIWLDTTTPYFEDSLNFCVPFAIEKPQWRKITEVIGWKSWFGIMLIMLVILVLLKKLSDFQSEKAQYRNYGYVVEKLFAIAISNSIHVRPRTTKVRYFLLVWMIFSLYLSVSYETYLISSLNTPDFEKQIGNLDDIIKSNLDILFLPGVEMYFESNDTITTSVKKLLRRWQTCYSLERCMQRAAYKRDAVVSISKLYTRYSIHHYIGVSGNPLIYCFKHNIVTFPITMYMRPGFPFARRINQIITRINSGGFIDWWGDNLFDSKVFKKSPNTQKTVLRFTQLKPIFLIFSLFCIFATIVFGAEVISKVRCEYYYKG